MIQAVIQIRKAAEWIVCVVRQNYVYNKAKKPEPFLLSVSVSPLMV